jgi:hypothetical protein
MIKSNNYRPEEKKIHRTKKSQNNETKYKNMFEIVEEDDVEDVDEVEAPEQYL